MKKWKLSILYLLIIIGAIFVIEITVSMTRGYGLFGTIERIRLKEPVWDAMRELSDVSSYSLKHWQSDVNGIEELWPDPQKMAQELPFWQLNDIQPYSKFNIWVLESAANGINYLYSPLSNINRKDPDPFTIVSCTMAKREEPKGLYHPYKKYPKNVMKYFGGEKWVCLLKDGSCAMLRSPIPPIPNAIVVFDNQIKPIKICYPKNILPSLKAIYPNLEVPKEAILD
jgi:hypothetical protein